MGKLLHPAVPLGPVFGDSKALSTPYISFLANVRVLWCVQAANVLIMYSIQSSKYGMIVAWPQWPAMTIFEWPFL
jgi:hypothetical protein